MFEKYFFAIEDNEMTIIEYGEAYNLVNLISFL